MSHERSSLDRTERDFRPSTEVERNLNPILDIDIDGKITYQNAAATSFLNSSGLKNPGIFLPEELPPGFWKSEEPSSFNYEKTIGEKIFFISLNPIPGASIARIYAFDITQKKALERQQLETKELLAKVTGSVTDMLYALDKELRYIYWNSACEVMTGLKSIDVIGSKWRISSPKMKPPKKPWPPTEEYSRMENRNLRSSNTEAEERPRY
jgi:PAS domain-containing protein